MANTVSTFIFGFGPLFICDWLILSCMMWLSAVMSFASAWPSLYWSYFLVIWLITFSKPWDGTLHYLKFKTLNKMTMCRHVHWPSGTTGSKGTVRYIGIFVSHLIHSFAAEVCLFPHVVAHCWYVIHMGTVFIILTLIYQSFMTVHWCFSKPPTCCASSQVPADWIPIV
jgi:hypothetical protein